MKSIFLVFALSVAASEAHVCLVNPPQRGGFPAGSLTVRGSNTLIAVETIYQTY